ncbi:MAG: hypothetical protein M1294_07740 [Firmicutes bacterium]|nr:hypothetical protein [Bacillota bacterium]
MAKRWQMLFAGFLFFTLSGCGVKPGSQPSGISSLNVAQPKTFPGVTAVSLVSVSPELQGAVTSLSLGSGYHLSAAVNWSNVPCSSSLLSWPVNRGDIWLTPYYHVSAETLSSAGMIVGGDTNARNFLTIRRLRFTWPASETSSPRRLAMALGGGAYAAALDAGGGWALVHVSPGKTPSVKRLDLPESSQLTGIHRDPEGGVWLATKHPDRILLWHHGKIIRWYTLPGVPVMLAGADFSQTSSSPANGVVVLVSSPDAIPGTADTVMQVSRKSDSWHKLPLTWTIPSTNLPFMAGATGVDWVSSRYVLLTLWDSGLQQVAIAKFNLVTGRAKILPHSNFRPQLLRAQPPRFPLAATKMQNLIVVGQGYGLAFYFRSSLMWNRFIK